MIHFLFLVAFLLLLGAIAFVATRGRLKPGGDLRREGPARIADALKRRNRLWMLTVVALVVIAALVELFLAPLHDALLDLQYDLGGSDLGTFDAALGGVSWLLYASILVGALIGVVAGTLAALKGVDIAGRIGAAEVI